jgi:uncharacterized protein YdhG (YjbR/CyaY superfamily)
MGFRTRFVSVLRSRSVTTRTVPGGRLVCHASTVSKDPRRESHFPGIEKRTGTPMSHWFSVMEGLAGRKYDDQMQVLQGDHGFTRAHANALIMYTKGSTTTRRVDTVDAFIAALPESQRATVSDVFALIARQFPDLEQVIAWNQPMIRSGKRYLFGMSAAKNHLLIAPFDASILDAVSDRLEGLKRNKKTVQVPNDWTIDELLIIDMIGMQLN